MNNALTHVRETDMLARPVARNSDPTTSHQAAESVENLSETRARILRLLREVGPMTDVMLRSAYAVYGGRPFSDSGLRTRRRELCNAALVRDSGQRERLRSGRLAIVWEAVPQNERGYVVIDGRVVAQ